MSKSYVVQIFEQDGVTPVETLDITKLKNKLTYTETINEGLGELILDLSYPFDNFGEGTRVKAMNIVDLYVADENNTLGRRVYRGFMSEYEPYVNINGATGVQVRCLGLVSLLERSFYKNGSNYTVTHSTQDPETIARAIIDHYNTIADSLGGTDGQESYNFSHNHSLNLSGNIYNNGSGYQHPPSNTNSSLSTINWMNPYIAMNWIIKH